jgi:hypothetical protein
MKKKGIMMLLVILCFILGLSSFADAAKESTFLTLPRVNSVGSLSMQAQQQQYPNWCWASVGKSICIYYGRYNTTQSDFYRAVLGSSAKIADYYLPNISDMSYGLAKLFSIASNYGARQVDIPNYIENHKSPVVVRWRIKSRPSGKDGHIVLAYGFSNFGDTIAYIEPATGTKTYLSLSNLRNNSEHTWTHSVYNIRK